MTDALKDSRFRRWAFWLSATAPLRAKAVHGVRRNDGDPTA